MWERFHELKERCIDPTDARCAENLLMRVVSLMVAIRAPPLLDPGTNESEVPWGLRSKAGEEK